MSLEYKKYSEYNWKKTWHTKNQENHDSNEERQDANTWDNPVAGIIWQEF